MEFNAHDVQVCLWKVGKLLSKTCVTILRKHPFFSLSMLCLFILYMSFPLVFWILVYSVPFVVCTSMIVCISFNIGNVKRHKDECDHEKNDVQYGRKTRFDANHDSAATDKDKKSFARVHSVRRRRAKYFRRDDSNNNTQQVEDKIAISSTNFNYDMVDKNALIEESPKEIREVEVDYSLVNSTKSSSCSPSESSKHDEFDEEELALEEENVNNNKGMMKLWNDNDHERNKDKMDVGISDSERTKRLESLIARRRSRKLLSLEVRRTLMNMDRNDHISSIYIPKNNNINRFLASNALSPSPGSAPSVLIPMRNPFDLPYDPQEEKPDLTGDNFEHEVVPLSTNNNKDMMFCRHESFSLGPENFDHHLKQISSSLPEPRFQQRNSSLGYEFFKQEKELDKEFSTIMKHKSYEASESKSTIEAHDDDYIKEIIQEYENGIHSNSDEEFDKVRTRATTKENSSSSPTSSEEDAQIFKIDRESILKSLSSMARRNVLEEENENNDKTGDHLRDRFYYTRRRTVSYSIASDLQVEVSEVSSPPLTIDENLSYFDGTEDNNSTYDDDNDGHMEKKITWDGEDSWAGSSLLDLSRVDQNESDEVSKQDIMSKVEFSRSNTPEGSTTSMNEKHSFQSWYSVAEFPDSGRTRANSLDEKIDKTFRRSVSLVTHTSNGYDSNKRVDCSRFYKKSEKELNNVDAANNNANQKAESATVELKTNEGQVEKLDEYDDTEHLATRSIKSDEDSEEIIELDHQEIIMGSAIVEDHISLESIQRIEGEETSFEEESIIREPFNLMPNIGANIQEATSNLMPNIVPFGQFVQSSALSPNSVLHPSCSLSSFGPYIDEEVHQFDAHVLTPIARDQSSTVLIEHSTNLPEVEVFEQESSETESPKQQENGVEPEVASSSSQITSNHEDYDQVSNEMNLRATSQSTHPSIDSNSPQSTQEELSRQIFIAEETHEDSNKSSNYEGQTENSALHEDKEHEQNLNNNFTGETEQQITPTELK